MMFYIEKNDILGMPCKLLKTNQFSGLQTKNYQLPKLNSDSDTMDECEDILANNISNGEYSILIAGNDMTADMKHDT